MKIFSYVVYIFLFLLASILVLSEISFRNNLEYSRYEHKRGSQELFLSIPSISLYMSVEEYTSVTNPWKIQYSEYPDTIGNLVIVGHSFTYANPISPPFMYLEMVEIGDEIYVEWKGEKYLYLVTRKDIVDKSDIEIEKASESRMITLYTCTPRYIGNKRLVIVGKSSEY